MLGFFLSLYLVADLRIADPATPAALPPAGLPPALLPSKIGDLRKEVEKAVRRYNADSALDREDPSRTLPEILRRLPSVVAVSVRPNTGRSTKHIVHILDWHYVEQKAFIRDLEAAAGKPVQPAEWQNLYQKFLIDLESIQTEQMAVICCLARKHDLRSLYVEGLTPSKVPERNEHIDAQRKMSAEGELLKRQIAELYEAQMELARHGDIESKEHERLLEQKVRLLQAAGNRWGALLALGAGGRLLIDRRIKEVLPLEDDQTLQATKLGTTERKLQVSGPANDKREEAMVQRLLMDKSPVVFIVLGGSHDLEKRLAAPERANIQYIRVTCRAYERTGESN